VPPGFSLRRYTKVEQGATVLRLNGFDGADDEFNSASLKVTRRLDARFPALDPPDFLI
jgi:hypothetical protein